ncbi:hypothetical protein I6B53_03295 [Schaalia sp. 19OD2882]|uniref:hypothetical protein n=1 Tax=Schaalia sp. 19OD2882 TaxID=2794089 RepID=UPI001C1E8D93|nr:hypothetical protein [Schaalia sp. 19OD2882]QWW20136.1 hypothetical protein I6B53_03295 [Schaalia sp. 19OD2882]
MSDTTEQQAAAPQETVESEAAETVDYRAEAEKWKALSRRNEAKAKENAEKARRLDEIEEQSKSEMQRVVEAREAAEKRAASAEAQLLRASVAASKGVPANLLSGTTEEELMASADALLAFHGHVQEAAGDSAPPASTSASHAGNRGDEIRGAAQLTREDLKGMTPEEINKARREGRLDTLLGR